jgi:hypothetical protein
MFWFLTQPALCVENTSDRPESASLPLSAR